MTNAARRHVAILAYDQLCMFEFGIAVEVFGLSRPEFDGLGWYTHEIVGIEPGPWRSTGGISIDADHDLDRLAFADLIIVPGWRGARSPIPDPLAQALRSAHSQGARIATLCSGVFVAAGAGLLAGKKATTHWRYAEILAELYPDIAVQPDILYLDEGQILTAAGSAAGIDLCLHIVRKDFGPQIANMVASRLVLPAHREGGQTQFVPRPVAPEGQGRIASLCDILLTRIDEPWSIAAMARIANHSERSLIRHFRQSTGMTPMDWLIGERVGRSRELLETTRLNLDGIAVSAGFGAVETFRHHFRARVGISPSAYRRNFGARGRT